MNVQDVNDLLSLMTATVCGEIDGSMCYDYTNQINESLKKHPKEVRDHFIECWITASRCITVNNKPDSKPSEMWQAICDGLAAERGAYKERRRIRKNLEIFRNKILPDFLESEVETYKGNAKSSNNPSKYLINCIADWADAVCSGVEICY